jgi:hypothetical protein
MVPGDDAVRMVREDGVRRMDHRMGAEALLHQAACLLPAVRRVGREIRSSS